MGPFEIALPSLCKLDISNVLGELTNNIEIVYYDQPRDLVDRILQNPGLDRVVGQADGQPTGAVAD